MLGNYLKVALRHLTRNKFYALLNIAGLAVGIACCLIILLYVQDEMSFDRFHDKGDRIYRMALERSYPERVRRYAIIPHSFAGAVKAEFPELEEAARLLYFPNNNLVVQVEDETYEEPYAYWADSTFFSVFGIPLLKGDQATALSKPNSIVLTEAVATRYFGQGDPVGRTLKMPGNDEGLIVTGVCANVPENSHLRFDLLMSSTSLSFLEQENYIGFSAYTYLLLKEGASAADLEAKLPRVVEKYAAGQVERQFGMNYQEYQAAGHGYHYFLQPLPSIYLDSNLESELRPPGSRLRIYIFLLIALFILIIACVNFMNLATARSVERAREVGIRKTLGALRGQVSGQFLTEAVLIAFISTGLALVLVSFLLPVFNNLSGKEFDIVQVVNLRNIPIFLGFALFVGLLSGLYPAFVLSGFRPIAVLKGKLTATTHGLQLRNSLVIFQFAISIVLIISTIVVFNQMQFIRNKELGFDKEHILTLYGSGFLQEQTEAFKEELSKLNGVRAVGGCNAMPGDNFFGFSIRKEGASEPLIGSGMVVDENFVSCLEMDLLAGRNFSESRNDSLSVILNETAVRELGLPDPVGQRLFTADDNVFNNGENTGSITTLTVIGVVKDFHFQSLHQSISPVFLIYDDVFQGVNNQLAVRIEPGSFQETVARIESLWRTFLPGQPFRFDALESNLASLYQSERIAQRVFSLFALLAIFIACMGLLGLAAYVTRQRTKEIGIRKVLGASVPNIVLLLSRDFLKLVFFAILIGAPLAWYAMSRWLEDFAYSIHLSWWMFVLAGGLAIVIAFLTVSYQSVRAALSNPVNALRDE